MKPQECTTPSPKRPSRAFHEPALATAPTVINAAARIGDVVRYEWPYCGRVMALCACVGRSSGRVTSTGYEWMTSQLLETTGRTKLTCVVAVECAGHSEDEHPDLRCPCARRL